MSEKLLKECEEAHYNLLRGMYYNGERNLGEVKIVWSNMIEDNAWNYGTRVITDNVEQTIESVSNFLKNKNRQPAFYITPFCKPKNLENILVPMGFKHVFSDAWMFFDNKKTNYKIPYELQTRARIDIVKNRTGMQMFKQIYNAAYSSGNGPYHFFPQYGKAVLNSFNKQMEGVVAKNYIAFVESNAVGILSLISQSNLFGIYKVQGKKTHPLQGMVMNCPGDLTTPYTYAIIRIKRRA